MSVYITSFYPLCSSRKGLLAIQNHGLNPYIDGSCRREPDFMNEVPCITGLCRPNFVRKLAIDDIVIYTTNQAGLGGRFLVSILQVNKILFDHSIAAQWYTTNGLPVPNNLMVQESIPFPLDYTHWRYGKDIETALERNPRHRKNPSLIVRLWNYGYVKRASDQPKVAICQYWENYKNIINPIEIEPQVNYEIFGRIPGTQNPAKLSDPEWAAFRNWLRNINVIPRK